MSIKLNNKDIVFLKLNNRDVEEVVLNGVKIFPTGSSIVYEFNFPWDSNSKTYSEYAFPAPTSQGDNFNRVNLIGGPGIEENQLNKLRFNVFGTGFKEKVSGNFISFGVWYTGIFHVDTGVYAKAEIRFGSNFIDLRRSQFSENNMSSWHDMVWDFNGLGLPLGAESWVLLGQTTSAPYYPRYDFVLELDVSGDGYEAYYHLTDMHPPGNYQPGTRAAVWDSYHSALFEFEAQ